MHNVFRLLREVFSLEIMDYWKRFLYTGNVEDYLKYADAVGNLKQEECEDDAVYDRGLGHPGKEYR